MSSDVIKVRKRPILVWIILIFFIFSAGYTLLSFTLILTGSVPLNPAQKAYFDNLNAIDYLVTLGGSTLNICGAVLLFLMRRAAFYFFLSALIISLMSTAWHILNKGWIEAIGTAGALGVFFGYGIIAAVCAYCWWLSRAGRLK